MTSAIVLSHRNVADELGHLEPWFERNGFTVRRIFREDRPELVDADLLVVLGSPSSVASGYCEQPAAAEVAISAPAISTMLATMPHADTVFVRGPAWGVQPHIEFTPDIVAKLGQAIDLSSNLWEPMHQAMKDDELDLSRRAGLFLDTFWSHANSLVWGKSGTQS